MPKARLSSGLSGISGTSFVAAELSRRGYVALLTVKNTKGMDILVANKDGTKTVSLEVKTHQGSGQKWILKESIENDNKKKLFFVFVRLNDLGSPEYHIVPQPIVAKYSREGHFEWLNAPGRNGRPHKDNSMRMFADPENKYLNKWDLLKLD